MVKAIGIKKYFRLRSITIKAVDDVSFEIKKGTTLGIVGESGCGKSTLARLLLRLLEPDTGSIYYKEKDISEMNNGELREFRRRCQIVMQDPYDSLNPRMRIEDAVLEGAYIHRLIHKSYDAQKYLYSLLDIVGIPKGSIKKFPHQFSGGEKQRICIARALSVQPEFIVLDEPVSNLDVTIQVQILNLLVNLKNRLNLTYLFISHDIGVVEYMCDNICVMKDGKIVETIRKGELYSQQHHPYTEQLLNAVLPPNPALARVKLQV